MEASGKRYIVYGDPDAEFRIWGLADIHWGNKGVAVDRLDSDIRAIQSDPCSFWFGLGDYADYIGIGDKRFDPDVVAAVLEVRDLGRLGRTLCEQVGDLLDPIASKCLGVGQGNHDRMYELRQEQQGLTAELAVRLGAPYLGYCSFCDLVFIYAPTAKACPKMVNESDAPKGVRRWTVRVFNHHGAGWAQTEGGKINRLVGFMMHFDADLTFVGHLHDQYVKARCRLRADDDCSRLVEQPQIGIMTGSYLRTYAQGATGYGEIKGYAPVPLGAVSAYITPYHQTLSGRVDVAPQRHLSQDFEEAAQ
jgi:hypothetical protein